MTEIHNPTETETSTTPPPRLRANGVRVGVPTANPVLDLVRDSFDGGDPYGSAILAWFAVADVAYVVGVYIPADWQYRPGAFLSEERLRGEGDYLAIEILDNLDRGLITEGQLIHAGEVLARYVGFCKRAGVGY